MRRRKAKYIALLLMAMLLFCANQTNADVNSQFVPDTDGIDTDGDGNPNNDHVYVHVGAGDGFVNMADGKLQYEFSYSLLTGVPDNMIMEQGSMAAEIPAPTLVFKEGQKVYLNLTNVGMMIRPD